VPNTLVGLIQFLTGTRPRHIPVFRPVSTAGTEAFLSLLEILEAIDEEHRLALLVGRNVLDAVTGEFGLAHTLQQTLPLHRPVGTELDPEVITLKQEVVDVAVSILQPAVAVAGDAVHILGEVGLLIGGATKLKPTVDAEGTNDELEAEVFVVVAGIEESTEVAVVGLVSQRDWLLHNTSGSGKDAFRKNHVHITLITAVAVHHGLGRVAIRALTRLITDTAERIVGNGGHCWKGKERTSVD